MGCRKIMYEYDNNEQKKACLSVVHTIFSTEEKGGISKKRYRYNGKEKDEESGLYYYGMRYYAPWMCRFVSTDPLAGKNSHQSSYAYADNNPIIKIDRLGMDGEKAQGNNSSGGKKSGRGQTRQKELAKRSANKTTETIEGNTEGGDSPTMENIGGGFGEEIWVEKGTMESKTIAPTDKTRVDGFKNPAEDLPVPEIKEKEGLLTKLDKFAKSGGFDSKLKGNSSNSELNGNATQKGGMNFTDKTGSGTQEAMKTSEPLAGEDVEVDITGLSPLIGGASMAFGDKASSVLEKIGALLGAYGHGKDTRDVIDKEFPSQNTEQEELTSGYELPELATDSSANDTLFKEYFHSDGSSGGSARYYGQNFGGMNKVENYNMKAELLSEEYKSYGKHKW